MKKADVSKTGSVDAVYSGIKKILEEARSTAYRAVNIAMVQAYWNIGRVVVEEEQKGKTKADYGEYLIKELAKRLTVEFGKGFTETNLRYMRLFYLLFKIANAESSLFPLKGIHHAVRDELPVVRPDLS